MDGKLRRLNCYYITTKCIVNTPLVGGERDGIEDDRDGEREHDDAEEDDLAWECDE